MRDHPDQDETVCSTCDDRHGRTLVLFRMSLRNTGCSRAVARICELRSLVAITAVAVRFPTSASQSKVKIQPTDHLFIACSDEETTTYKQGLLSMNQVADARPRQILESDEESLGRSANPVFRPGTDKLAGGCLAEGRWVGLHRVAHEGQLKCTQLYFDCQAVLSTSQSSSSPRVRGGETYQSTYSMQLASAYMISVSDELSSNRPQSA